jgi:hypothetical protein
LDHLKAAAAAKDSQMFPVDSSVVSFFSFCFLLLNVHMKNGVIKRRRMGQATYGWTTNFNMAKWPKSWEGIHPTGQYFRLHLHSHHFHSLFFIRFHLLKRSFPPPPSSSASILAQKWQCSPADLLRSASVQMALAELLTGTLGQQAIPAGQQFVAANSKRRKRGGGAEGTSMAAEGFFEDAAEECAAAVEDETQKEGGGRGEEEEIAPVRLGLKLIRGLIVGLKLARD